MKFHIHQKVQWVEMISGVVLRNIPYIYVGNVIGFKGNKVIIMTPSGEKVEKCEKDLVPCRGL